MASVSENKHDRYCFYVIFTQCAIIKRRQLSKKRIKKKVFISSVTKPSDEFLHRIVHV